jgi:hypothetical protein
MDLEAAEDYILIRRDYWQNKSMEENGNELYCRSKHSKDCEKYSDLLKQPLFMDILIGKHKLFKGFVSPIGWDEEYSEQYITYKGDWFCYHSQIGVRNGFKTIKDLLKIKPTLTEKGVKILGI